jgi:flagellar basal-body rod protein FlgF
MIVDARTYTLKPGATPAYLKGVEEVAWPIQKKHGFDLKGYFTVETDAGPRYTRAGRFQLNEERQIVNSQGHPVLSANGGPILIPEDSIEITIAPDGTVSAGTEAVDRIGIVTFDNHQELRREGTSFFTTDEAPQEAEDARIVQGMLEESNVNAVIEITKLIEIHRTYAANQQLLQDEHERARRAISRLVAPPNT